MGSYFNDIITDRQYLDRSYIELVRAIWPQRCAITNKWLWIKPAIRVRTVFTGPGTPILIDRWIEPKAYTLQCLKGWD